MKLKRWVGVALATAMIASAAHTQEPGRITGIGGVFIKSVNPRALSAWYRDVLGIKLESWGGATLKYDAPGHPSEIVWSAFPPQSGYFAPSTRDVMINFAVDDLDAFVARLKAKGVPILKQNNDATGRYAWIMDPDGTKIELREPQRK
jgi:predicted enzyme related to lactoylglutathione lyase